VDSLPEYIQCNLYNCVEQTSFYRNNLEAKIRIKLHVLHVPPYNLNKDNKVQELSVVLHLIGE
jgi:Icc-related predicted phosphoesterase